MGSKSPDTCSCLRYSIAWCCSKVSQGKALGHALDRGPCGHCIVYGFQWSRACQVSPFLWPRTRFYVKLLGSRHLENSTLGTNLRYLPQSHVDPLLIFILLARSFIIWYSCSLWREGSPCNQLTARYQGRYLVPNLRTQGKARRLSTSCHCLQLGLISHPSDAFRDKDWPCRCRPQTPSPNYVVFAPDAGALWWFSGSRSTVLHSKWRGDIRSHYSARIIHPCWGAEHDCWMNGSPLQKIWTTVVRQWFIVFATDDKHVAANGVIKDCECMGTCVNMQPKQGCR